MCLLNSFFTTYNKDDGTGRGDKLVQYRNSYNDFSFAVQVQPKKLNLTTHLVHL